jgi:ABC-type antimicrobial peptide transport system permease subunit
VPQIRQFYSELQATPGVTGAAYTWAAGLLPARRASTISPLVALRSE